MHEGENEGHFFENSFGNKVMGKQHPQERPTPSYRPAFRLHHYGHYGVEYLNLTLFSSPLD